MAINSVTGTFAATGVSAALPVIGGAFNVSLAGTFVGTVVLQRSFDQGATWKDVVSWTAPVETSRTEIEDKVQYRYNCTAYTSGTVTYRLSF